MSASSSARWTLLRQIALFVIIALGSTAVFSVPVQAQDDLQFGFDDVVYTDVDMLRVIDVLQNDITPDTAVAGEPPVVVVFGMEFGSLTMGIDATSGAELGLYEPAPGFSGLDTGEYMVCWGTQCDGATVSVYVGTAACTISADSVTEPASESDEAPVEGDESADAPVAG